MTHPSHSKAVKSGTDATGEWIPWEGGECPVGWRTIVMVRFRYMYTLARKSRPASRYNWHHTGSGGDIVAYRVDVPAPTALPPYEGKP